MKRFEVTVRVAKTKYYIKTACLEVEAENEDAAEDKINGILKEYERVGFNAENAGTLTEETKQIFVILDDVHDDDSSDANDFVNSDIEILEIASIDEMCLVMTEKQFRERLHDFLEEERRNFGDKEDLIRLDNIIPYESADNTGLFVRMSGGTEFKVSIEKVK